MAFNRKQIEEMMEIIKLTHVSFIGEQLGTDSLSSDDKKILKKFGIKTKKFKKKGIVYSAFRFGLLADALGNERAKKMNYTDFKKFLAEGGFIPLSNQQKLAIEFIEQRMTNDIRGLSTKIEREIAQINEKSTKKNWEKYSKRVDKKTKEAVADNLSVRELALGIQGNIEKWGRDFDRIADFNLHEAFDQGKAMSIQQKDSEALVYKDVYAGACKHCIRLYLTGDIGSKPQIFKIKDLISNGNNIGRKVDDWKPVVGSTHPWCRCTIEYIPKGYEWSNETKSFEPVKRKTKRKSKVKITITKEN